MTSKNKNEIKIIRCIIYTRKSSQEGLEQSFNSLDAQREACESYIQSQQHEGWKLIPTLYDDGGFSGGNMKRPALKKLMHAIENASIDIIVVYKVDRLSRSLADFVRIIDLLDKHNVSFVSVTQHFNTSNSMGRLTLNVLLSFAQFEREVTGERIRDKIAASKQKGLWMGGVVPIGYDVKDKQLVINEKEASLVTQIYTRYLALGCVRRLKTELDSKGVKSKARIRNGSLHEGHLFSRGALYTLLKNPIYIGKTTHSGKLFEGKHDAIVDLTIWRLVKNKLSDNTKNKNCQLKAKNPSLLTGLLFDDNNNPMSPTHTRKKNRRYRYYISQALLQYKEQDAGSIHRLSAQIIEDLVIDHLKNFLKSGKQMIDTLTLKNLSVNVQQKLVKEAGHLANKLDASNSQEIISLINKLVSKIIVGHKNLSITYAISGFYSLLLPKHHLKESENWLSTSTTFTIPVQLKRCGSETKLILTSGRPSKANKTTVSAIQNAIRKALIWNNALITGKVRSVKELAKQNNVTHRYIGQIIKLAHLAPGIIDNIIRGDIPASLSLDKLKKGFPLDWKEQHKVLKFE